MKFKYFIIAMVLSILSATAQDKKGATPQSSTSVQINGQPIKGNVLEIDGKHYVAVEDMAQSLRGTISYGDGQIALTFSQLSSMNSRPPLLQPPAVAVQPPSSQLPSVAAQPNETGRIKGTLTYFFNVQTGNKPDNGSKIWLVNGRAEIPANQKFIGTTTALGSSGNPEQYKAIKYSVADENGNFEMLNIPPGQYTLVMQSAHTKGALKENGSFFGRGNGRTARDSSGRLEFLNLQIKTDETVDGSKDFGPDLGM